jgi:hypothetical protein
MLLRIIPSVLFALALAPGAQAAAMRDVSAGHPYANAIEYIQQHGMAEGYSDGTFRPDNTINRAEMVTILVEASGDGMGGSGCFRDVNSEWYAPYVCGAQSHGMVSGYPDGTFRPGNPVSFAEAAALVVRQYEGNMPATGGAWYMPYATQLQQWNAVPPTVEWMDAPITRGEMSYILWRAETAQAAPQQPLLPSLQGIGYGGGSTANYVIGGDRRYFGNDDDENDDDDDNHDGMSLLVQASSEEALPGSQVQFTIVIENHDSSDRETDIAASLDSGLQFVQASGGSSADNEWVTWNDFEVEGGDEVILTILAKVLDSAQPGSRQSVRVSLDGNQKSDGVVVKGTIVPSPVGDPVLHWNDIAMAANATDHTGTYGAAEQGGPGASSRALAITHAAIYDAVNSIDRTHEPYLVLVPIPGGQQASMDAAVAAAAHETLVALFPKQSAIFDAARQDHMNKIPEGSAKTLGIMVGHTVASQMMSTRNNDGSTAIQTYVPSQLPGRHRVDPLNPNQPFMGDRWGEVRPFVLTSGSQFRAPPPPSIDSAEYAAAYDELIAVGGDGVTSPTSRTAEQTKIGLYWAYDGVKKIGTPPRLYNQITQVIAKQKGNTVVQNARLFALLNIAQADAGIVAWESKYHYDFWRPILGIREADAGTGPSGLGDNNPLTQGFANWVPLGAPMSNSTNPAFTPPFPAYPSGHATFGAAVFRTIERFYGTDNVPFTFTSDELNGVTTDQQGNPRPVHTRSFTRLSDAAKENAQSRMYLGIHWQFDATEGIKMGNKIADYIYDNALEPIGN